MSIPEPYGTAVTSLYVPNHLTNVPLNHNHLFIAMESGNVYIFDIVLKQLSSYVVKPNREFTGFNGEKRVDPVIGIKAHWIKMHRLLFAYADTGVGVFSLNKNREIRSIKTQGDDTHKKKGKVVAVEWIGPNCSEFIVGFEHKALEIFKAEGSNNRPVRVLNFAEENVKKMRLFFFNRPAKPEHHFLIIEFSKNAEHNPLLTNLK